MKYVQLAIIIGIIGVVAYFGWTFYKGYRAATGSVPARIIAAAKGSATILWAQFCALVGLATSGLVNLSDLLGDPSVGQAIQTYLKPQYVAAALVVISGITIWARTRKGSKDPLK